jgi:preprotein translocase SecE subunit
MARDRKRAKQRRQRQQGGPARAAQRLADPGRRTEKGETAMPDPLDQAVPDVDMAQLAEAGVTPVEEVGDESADGEVYADEVTPEESTAAASAALGRPATAERRPAEQRDGNRFVNFLRASWRELQRVQWPNRQQVAQATGVVLGFVVIAGGYLGLLDAICSRLVNAIL